MGDGSGRITVHDLTKQFGSAGSAGVTAVSGLSFTVEPGGVTGFLGPNGSGKTTTLRMILGLVTPTSGEARIDGARFAELDAPGRVVGAVLEAQGFHPARSGRAHLRVAAAALGVPDRRVDEVLGLVGLADAAGRGGRRLVARHEAAPGAGHRAAGRPARAGPRRARQRPGPRGHRLAAGVPAGVRPAGAARCW